MVSEQFPEKMKVNPAKVTGENLFEGMDDILDEGRAAADSELRQPLDIKTSPPLLPNSPERLTSSKKLDVKATLEIPRTSDQPDEKETTYAEAYTEPGETDDEQATVVAGTTAIYEQFSKMPKEGPGAPEFGAMADSTLVRHDVSLDGGPLREPVASKEKKKWYDPRSWFKK